MKISRQDFSTHRYSPDVGSCRFTGTTTIGVSPKDVIKSISHHFGLDDIDHLTQSVKLWADNGVYHFEFDCAENVL